MGIDTRDPPGTAEEIGYSYLVRWPENVEQNNSCELWTQSAIGRDMLGSGHTDMTLMSATCEPTAAGASVRELLLKMSSAAPPMPDMVDYGWVSGKRCQ